MSKIDKYNLGRSTTSPITGRQELTKDLPLTSSITSEEGLIVGTVTSGGQPVEGATVKVFDINNVPIAHGNTGPNGQYTIAEIVKGSYLVTATKVGYLTPVVVSVPVIANRPTTVNISLAVDPDASKNTLFGRVKQDITLIPLADVTVNIYKVVEGVETLVDTTKTNNSGQYLAPYLDNGDYVIIADKAGYNEVRSATITLLDTDIVDVDLFMIANAATNKGTVSGIITDAVTTLPIANATVALYQVIGDVETIVQLTKTTVAGRYLFGNVSEGSYLVKAFAQKDVVV